MTETSDQVQSGQKTTGLGSIDEQRSRFEQNRELDRSYDKRPAIQHLAKPNILLTTREPEKRTPSGHSTLLRSYRAPIVFGLLLIAAASLLGVGVLLGQRLAQTTDAARSDEAAASPVRSADNSAPPESTSAPPVPTADSSASTSLAPETTTLQVEQFAVALSAIDLSRLSFVPGTARFTLEGQQSAVELASALLLDPDAPVSVVVRTFSETTPGENHGLGVQQADALVEKLTTEGVNRERLAAVALGNSGIERPNAAGALFFRSDTEEVQAQLVELGPLVFNGEVQDVGEAEVESRLATVAALLEQTPGAELQLVGYAWSEESRKDNHDVSHEILDSAVESLTDLGVSRSRIGEVGLGWTAVPLTGQQTVIEVETGRAAAVAVGMQSISSEGIDFIRGSRTLTHTSEEVLLAVANVLALDPSVRVEIAAHTYSETSSQRNHDLSEFQGQAVVDALVSAGIDRGRLELVWHGDPPHFETTDGKTVITFTVLR